MLSSYHLLLLLVVYVWLEGREKGEKRERRKTRVNESALCCVCVGVWYTYACKWYIWQGVKGVSESECRYSSICGLYHTFLYQFLILSPWFKISATIYLCYVVSILWVCLYCKLGTTPGATHIESKIVEVRGAVSKSEEYDT